MQLLFKLNRPFEVASRGYSFIISFSKALAVHEVYGIQCLLSLFSPQYHTYHELQYEWSFLTFIFSFLFPTFPVFSFWSCSQSILPFCMREVWVITACMSLVNETASHYKEGLAAPDIEKEFYRLQGDLYSLCRVKVKFLCVS